MSQQDFITAIEGDITRSRVQGDDVIITVDVGYVDGDPNYGYDAESSAMAARIFHAAAEAGLSLTSAGVEEDRDGGGEYWVFTVRP